MWQILSKIRRSQPIRTPEGIWLIFLYFVFHAENNLSPCRQVIKNVIIAISRWFIFHLDKEINWSVKSTAEIIDVWSPVWNLRAADLISESQSAHSRHRTLLGLDTSQRSQTSLGRMLDRITKCHFHKTRILWWKLKYQYRKAATNMVPEETLSLFRS